MPAEAAIRAAPRRGAPTAAIVVAALFGLAAGDALKPPPEQVGARLAVASIDLYRAAVSPLLNRTGLVRCRFRPTCSAYGREAIVRYGLPRGALLTAGRLLRCQPFSKGGWDPVPRLSP